MARFYVLLDGDITQERTEESIRIHLAPYHVEFKETEWFSTYHGKHRYATGMMKQLTNIAKCKKEWLKVSLRHFQGSYLQVMQHISTPSMVDKVSTLETQMPLHLPGVSVLL